MKMFHQAKESVREQFSKNAVKYITSESHAKGKDLQLLLDWANPQDNWIALDIATGGGHVAKTVAPHVNGIYATDLTVAMLENTANHLASKHPNMDFIIADAEELPFLKDSFDLVTCRIAPHHFPNPEAFVKEVARVLKKNGKFLLIDNVAPEDAELAEYVNMFEKLRDESHVKCLSIQEWKELFKQVGLVEIRSESRKKKLNYSSWLERMVKDEDQAEKVKRYMLNGSPRQRDYFQVRVTEGTIQSAKIDEWMVLCEKR
ncbi:methyltransferase domain-containing protein [Radiobacillus kanasensis]|uniref:class I SAM-dependent methyltransferase n=1 Tax=Radiobacillus kanasensis TaxID=2844358 RepID=UPI001E4C438F|nr:class I SAM-dependent methyltransferase [Radiobacillus kanasensis]UFU00255.1 methyltransferase domain-containing protein [Radiobacillus kanasensis]